MAAADEGKVSIPFWDFIKRNLNDEGQRKILLQQDKSGKSSLHHAMANWHGGADVVLNIYKEIFGGENSIQLIRDEDLDGRNVLAYAIDKARSSEVLEESWSFLRKLFSK